MAEPKRIPRRDEIARIEVGYTTITGARARALIVLFVATMAAVPIVQHVHEVRDYLAGRRLSAWPQAYDIFDSVVPAGRKFVQTDASLLRRVLAVNRLLFRDINAYEDALEDESVVGRALVPPAQYVLTAWLGAGNEQAYCGRGGWVFYRPDFDYVTGPGFLEAKRLARRAGSGDERTPSPQPDPRKAIRQFKAQLDQRGITLILVPTPVKPTIHPEKLSAACDDRTEPLQNPSYARFKKDLRDEGVLVFDVARALVDAKRSTGEPQYLATDTHWRPAAVRLAAQRLKQFIDAHVNLPPVRPAGYKRETLEVTNLGDITVMLNLPSGQTVYGPERVRIDQVRTPAAGLWRAARSADVLLLGDSFSNVYSVEAMGWGESAGLIEQLSFLMQRPLDRIVRNDDGAYATRRILARELAKGRDRLAGKRLVIWQFALREVAGGDWKLIDMTLGRPRPARFVVPERAREMVAAGIIEAISPAPRPGTVPYKDHIVALHLTDLETETGPVEGGEAIVYMWSMRDNVWTPAARYRPGRRLTVRLRPWSDVEEEFGAINRSELDDEDLQLEEPCWGEVAGQ